MTLGGSVHGGLVNDPAQWLQALNASTSNLVLHKSPSNDLEQKLQLRLKKNNNFVSSEQFAGQMNHCLSYIMHLM